ncbi:Bacterial Ig-like domain (group 2) [Listeria grayi]|uniref:Bacterial Ig-like domain (Group 2) n=1 Tax=Listeria grayi TaxID=1641 RepID=A0A378MDM5_LISGR|nr:putative mucin/carbohydrate-binding domain-containing protein [Listeria grayi]STY43924.1 Bacterial Ig-like domain (group 2) [Listeria grayi]
MNQSYRSLPEEELPKTEEEQKQLFILMTSKVAHRDLTPFFEHWRFTITDETKEKLKALKLPTLEKEIWKDVLATEQEEKAGTYRISKAVGPYSVPQVEWKSGIPQFPFENLRNALNANDLVANMYSTPIASNTSLVTTGTVSDGTSFDIQNAYAYFTNDLGIPNKIPFSVKVTPGDSIVMTGQRGRYAVLSYDPKAKTLLARGNSKKILENLPNNLYPRVKVYDKNMQTVKKVAEGYGKTYGYEFAGKLDNVPVNIGDIVEIYHRESAKRVQRYKDNKPLTTNKDTYYYQITKTGWQEIDFNPKSIEGSAIAAKVGDSGEMDLQINPANSILPSDYEYTVSDPSIIKVDSKGKWQALKKGKTTIAVTAKLPDVGELAGADYPAELKTTIEVEVTNSGAPIKIHYVDLQGNPLTDVSEQVIAGDAGDVINLEQYALKVPGYTLLTETANKTAVVSTKEQDISFIYGGNIISVTGDNIGTTVGKTGKIQIKLVPEITEMPAEKLIKAKRSLIM